jgi:hypothetical protein
MKCASCLLVAAVAALAGAGTPAARGADEDGVALAIVYDTSGSMKETVRDERGQPTPKYLIANRALIAVARQIQAFATNHPADAPRRIDAALYTFNNGTPRETLKFARFDAAALEQWARNFSSPSGGTPLGNSLSLAAQTVLDSPLTRKHVLIITDGLNTLGPQPSAVLPGLNRRAEELRTGLSVHFVAFDVDAKAFDPVKKLGATVVGAADEKQLNTQLDFILRNEILLEKAEPAKKP